MTLSHAGRLLLGAACLLAVGCAAPEKYVLPIDVPAATKPASGPAIVLAEVVDAREFIAPGKSRRQRFWSWNGGRDRTWFSFESTVKLSGVTLAGPDGASGDTVEASVSLDTLFTARPQAFANTTAKGIEQFVNRLGGSLGR